MGLILIEKTFFSFLFVFSLGIFVLGLIIGEFSYKKKLKNY